ncbi:MAG: NADH-quinone oxidoreductase subunit A [Methanomassiliicoccales archaeon]|jgi:NADH:ubiquinone oxidoreductase subunit 3 (subunit A)
MLIDAYYPIAVFGLIAVLFPALAFWASRFFRPTKFMPLKKQTYECGEQPIGHGQIQFHVQFYLYAIIFVIFDIVTVFLMIWALVFADLSETARLYMVIFLVLLLVGVTYALKKEAVFWI